MSVRRGNDRIEQRVTAALPPGERFVAAFQAGEGIAARLAFRYRVVAVTDRQIHVYAAKLWRVCDPGRRLSSHPLGGGRETSATPQSGPSDLHRRPAIVGAAALKRELADALFRRPEGPQRSVGVSDRSRSGGRRVGSQEELDALGEGGHDLATVPAGGELADPVRLAGGIGASVSTFQYTRLTNWPSSSWP